MGDAHCFEDDASCSVSTHVGTALAIGAAGSLLVGPTLGHIYSGRTWNRGLLYRIAGIPPLALGAALASTGAGVGGHDSSSVNVIGAVLAATGGVMCLVGTVIEIRDAPAAARRYNARLAPQLAFSPSRGPGGMTPGVVLTSQF
jgi:hypothetical protein